MQPMMQMMFLMRFKLKHYCIEEQERLDVIAAERTKFHLREGGSFSLDQRRNEVNCERQTNSFINESEIYGRDEDKERLIRFLTDDENNDDRGLSVLPIVGLGGLGKTTLAQLAYNDDRIKRHFELQVWVCISLYFDIRRITKAIIESSTWNVCDLSDIEPMQHQLRGLFEGRRVLLVLDDVWNENEHKWDELKHLLSGGTMTQGSKVIVTTRSIRVASIMGTVPSLQLSGLSEDHCWTLFRQRAFGRGKGEETLRLVAIGKDIVKKCGGVPLAAKALGSLMAFKRSEGEWLSVRDSQLWRLPEEEVGILPALRLSYDHLPSHLKQCFAYCSIFPKDYEIDKEKLIEMWVAQGFILPFDEGTMLEDIGNEYFNNLLWRSFFQDVQWNGYANKVTCKMHDLIHDLARYVAGEECFVAEIGSKERLNIPGGCRFSAVVCSKNSSEIPFALDKQKKLRSLVLLLKDSYTYIDLRSAVKEVPARMFSSLPHLRVLDLSRSNIKELPIAIGRLKHLRLLDMSRTEVETLPNSITSLINLYRLNLEYCCRLRELPQGIASMFNLRHLRIYECLSLTQMPKRMGQLQDLLTLSKYVVGEDVGRTIMELRSLNLLCGQLQIDNLEKVRDASEANEANLKAKQNLRSLYLWWKMGVNEGPRREEYVDEDVLEALQPHPSLEKLVIIGYRGFAMPKWMTTAESLPSLSYLVSITLNRLKRLQELPPFGLLPALKVLNIYDMETLCKIGNEFFGESGTFPCLQELNLCDMPNLKEWLTNPVSGSAAFPCLSVVTLKGCPNLTVEPCIPPSIQTISISYSNAGVLSADSLRKQRSSSLVQLQIQDCKSLSSSSLSSVSMFDGLQYLTVLKDLSIEHCEQLTCLPLFIFQQQQLGSSICSITISHNPNLISLGGEEVKEKIFTALKYLEIRGCHRLVTLPEWVGRLVSLQSLKICHCSSLNILPHLLVNLAQLQDLTIKHCPLLTLKCWRNIDIRKEWHKMEHIRHIDIDF
ncbi:putative disease resistance protein RGA3 isoform X2 [Dioscorea cayenensis subsp. rotundata]|uniref:Disease resistance protein RGA3 isoform X2 n=1 Tax=Dioscorea cayennensis subsp. rotundata TaxID=55577 RepID=A0AB40CGC8_DIOCR|nr:putative disease resistance protein RGA3 isoform X2 [Dioscorea cayenensis subsp. rotundata]